MTKTYHSKKYLSTETGDYAYYSLEAIQPYSSARLADLPYSLRPILEALLRHFELGEIDQTAVLNLFDWQPDAGRRVTVPFYPGRILLQDFTGIPVMNDLTAMRAALQRAGGDPGALQPVIPVDLVVDHSVQLDYAAFQEAFEKNIAMEYERNHERYAFLRWCQNAFENFRVVPPGNGIVHQINLEYLAQVVLQREMAGEITLFPDTLLGTDSHTTMINGLGVAGWGVGGLEALSAMLGQPVDIVIPHVFGVELTGELKTGVTPTDLALSIIHMLRKTGVVDKFVEFYGTGLNAMPLADRDMIANMTPESGATMLYFPIDRHALAYLSNTGRSAQHVEMVRAYTFAQKMLL